jgi:hypothetical protein
LTGRHTTRRGGNTGDGQWFIYFAFCPLDVGDHAIKVGVSETPFSRLLQINQGSPFPVRLGYFAAVGGKRHALRAEFEVLTAFRTYRTRGEWLRHPVPRQDREEMSNTVKRAVLSACGRLLSWHRVTGGQIAVASYERMRESFAKWG